MHSYVFIAQGQTSNFDELLITDDPVSIHQHNLQLLVTKIYQTMINLNPSFMKETFIERETNKTCKQHICTQA